MPDQTLNQKRLEAYLSACMYPSFDVAAHMEATQHGRPAPQRTDSNGTSTPRDLNTRLKLLELYTLHVLPRNNQWDYAQDFISMSEVLDEERRDAFLGALHQLKEEKSHDAIREAELSKRQQEEEEANRRKREEARRRQEEEQRQQANKPASIQRPVGISDGVKDDRRLPTRANVSKNLSSNTNQSSHQNQARGKDRLHPVTMYQRLALMLSSLQSTLMGFTRSAQDHPLAALRNLFFLFAFIVAFARRDIRQRIRRMMQDAMLKLRQTVGMGTKVSYI